MPPSSYITTGICHRQGRPEPSRPAIRVRSTGGPPTHKLTHTHAPPHLKVVSGSGLIQPITPEFSICSPPQLSISITHPRDTTLPTPEAQGEGRGIKEPSEGQQHRHTCTVHAQTGAQGGQDSSRPASLKGRERPRKQTLVKVVKGGCARGPTWPRGLPDLPWVPCTTRWRLTGKTATSGAVSARKPGRHRLPLTEAQGCQVGCLARNRATLSVVRSPAQGPSQEPRS